MKYQKNERNPNDDGLPEEKGSPDDPKGRRPEQGGPSPVRFFRGGIGWLVFLGLALLLLMLFNKSYDSAQTMTISGFYTELENANVEEIVIGDNNIRGELKSLSGQPKGSTKEFKVDFPPDAMNFEFVQDLTQKATAGGAELRYETSRNIFLEVFLSPLLIYLLIFGLIWFLIFRQLRSSAGGAGMLGSFGRSRHRVLTKERTNVTFNDVAGIDEAKDEVSEIVEFLKNPGKFQKLGGRIPRGVLLIGDPGCGKTLLAKAIAGEAEVPFFSISGSDFVEMFVGVGASRVRDLFSQAKSNAPCIIFLDEIDAVGRRRGVNFNGGGHDEREQTLNAILVEMDGFDTSDQVIVIAATNRADVLDPALTRPGRFDRQVYVPLPDIKGRHEILKVHAKGIKTAENVDLWKLARGTPMFSGADLAAIINEAAITATLAGKERVEQEDLEEARDRVRWGRAKRSRVIDEHEKKIVAYHEGGHALASALIPEGDPLHKVSIIPRGQAGGMTMMLPEGDRHMYSRRFIMATMQAMLAGRVAEELACEDISSGASDDIKRATQLARTMVCEWGMSDRVGPIRYGQDNQNGWPMDGAGRDYSEETAKAIDAEIQKVVREAHEKVRNLLSENRQKLDLLAEALLKYETLDAEDVLRVVRGESIEKPTVNDLLTDAAKIKDTISFGETDERN